MTLYWLGLARSAENFQVFVHVVREQGGEMVAQADGVPGRGVMPTTRWYPGEIIIDSRDIPLPADLTPGRYNLHAGLYRLPEVRNLQPTGGEVERAPGGRIFLQTVDLGEDVSGHSRVPPAEASTPEPSHPGGPLDVRKYCRGDMPQSQATS